MVAVAVIFNDRREVPVFATGEKTDVTKHLNGTAALTFRFPLNDTIKHGYFGIQRELFWDAKIPFAAMVDVCVF